MKKAVIGFLVAGLILAVIGIGVTSVSLAMGMQLREIPVLVAEKGWNRWGFFNRFDRWSVRNWNGDWIFDDSDFTSTDYSVSDVKCVKVDMTIGEFEIRRTTEKDVRVETGQSFTRYAKVELNGDILEITNHNNRYKSKAILYLPDGMILDDVNLEIGAGTATVDYLNAKNIDAQVQAGEFRGDIIFCETSIWDVAAGSIRIKDLTSNDISLFCQAGSINVDIRGERDDFKGEIECDIGAVSFDGKTHHALSSDVRIGSSNSQKTLNANCAVGEIDIRFINSKSS